MITSFSPWSTTPLVSRAASLKRKFRGKHCYSTDSITHRKIVHYIQPLAFKLVSGFVCWPFLKTNGAISFIIFIMSNEKLSSHQFRQAMDNTTIMRKNFSIKAALHWGRLSYSQNFENYFVICRNRVTIVQSMFCWFPAITILFPARLLDKVEKMLNLAQVN